MNSDTKTGLVGLFGLGVITVWLTLSTGSDFFYCLTSRNWPKAQALITASSVVAGKSNVGTWWAPNVEYEYRVGGKPFHAANIRYSMPSFYDEEAAANVLTPYAQGHAAVVAYDPGDPSRSVLEPGVPAGIWKQGLIPLFFWLLSGYLFYDVNNPSRRGFLSRSDADA